MKSTGCSSFSWSSLSFHRTNPFRNALLGEPHFQYANGNHKIKLRGSVMLETASICLTSVINRQKVVFMHENCPYGFAYFKKSILYNSLKSPFSRTLWRMDRSLELEIQTHRAQWVVWNNWEVELCKKISWSNMEFAGCLLFAFTFFNCLNTTFITKVPFTWQFVFLCLIISMLDTRIAILLVIIKL